jgi:nucleotide-binding universal stress UspA family protein
MAKRILIPLDEYDYTRFAIQYGIELAVGDRWEITGLSIVDVPSIEKSIGPVPAGASYFAQRQEEQRKHQELGLAQKMITEFEEICREQKIAFQTLQREGSPKEIIVEESNYHDLVLTGWKTSFRYGQEPDKDLQYEVISHGICPFLLIPQDYRRIHKVLLCYDGKTPSTKAIHQFIQFNIYRDSEFTLLTINDNPEEGEPLLEKMATYLKTQAVTCQRVCLPGRASTAILSYATDHNFDLIVLGAHGQSLISKFFFGSTAQKLIETANRPLFIYH